MYLHSLGWQTSHDEQFLSHRNSGFVPARVSEEQRERYLVIAEEGELRAEVTGRMIYTAGSRLDYPAVGDWVAISPTGDGTALIHAILPRRTLFTRKAAGETTEVQVLVANIDTTFVVTDAGHDFNLRRLERYLVLVRESGSEPVVVINKADLNERAFDLVPQVREIAPESAICLTNAAAGDGLDALAPFLREGRTVALLGSSGVGKSTLVNRLLGEERMKTLAIREADGRGRHTSTFRKLLVLPQGGVVIDTPGMREIQLWAGEEMLAETFDDIEALAEMCRFRDCGHGQEPGCAVRRALEDGSLADTRFASYQKLRREVRYLATRQDMRAMLEERARWKRISRLAQEYSRMKYGGRR